MRYSDATSNVAAHIWRSAALSLIDSNVGYWSSNNFSAVTLGDNGAWSDTALGCFRYFRIWDHALSDAELTSEFGMTPSSGTPAAKTSGLLASWPLATGTDTTDWSGNSRSPTISGGSTSSEEPTIGGGGGEPYPPALYQRRKIILRRAA